MEVNKKSQMLPFLQGLFIGMCISFIILSFLNLNHETNKKLNKHIETHGLVINLLSHHNVFLSKLVIEEKDNQSQFYGEYKETAAYKDFEKQLIAYEEKFKILENARSEQNRKFSLTGRCILAVNLLIALFLNYYSRRNILNENKESEAGNK